MSLCKRAAETIMSKLPSPRLLPIPPLCLALLACASAPQIQSGIPAITQPQLHPHVRLPDIRRPEGETPAWWYRAGAVTAATQGSMEGRAKNLILFVGDGMSLTTVTAARILAGQRLGQSGEEYRLSWEEFPHTALSRTYNIDLQTPDSAGTMSAMATGVKTRAGVISVDQSMWKGDCTGLAEGRRLTLWELAAEAGLQTGVVSTTRLTHATPGATLAHVPERNWESDANLPDEATRLGCTDIARQMIHSPYGAGPKVLMGGGRANFMPEDQADPEYPALRGKRLDGRDLIAEWRIRYPTGRYVWNSAQLAAAPDDAPLLGLFEPDHMQWADQRDTGPGGEPSLAEMTRAAITRLSDASNGFVLLVEGGRIDHGNHAGNAFRALNETIAMSEAVDVARQMTSVEDTLILVTADHSHTLSLVGYPGRGNPVLGTVAHRDRNGERVLARDDHGLPYTSLSYANGPGYRGPGPRPDLTEVDTAAPDYLQEALVPMIGESHGGDDVGLWASGPGSAAIRGSIEQNVIFHFLLQAHPQLRAFACQRDGCSPEGVPVELPRP